MTPTLSDTIRAGLIAAIEAITPRAQGPAWRCVSRARGATPSLERHTSGLRLFELVSTGAPVDGGVAGPGPVYWIETIEIRVLYVHPQPGDPEALQRTVGSDIRDLTRAVDEPAWWLAVVGLDYARAGQARYESSTADDKPAWLVSVPVTIYYWEA